MRNGASMPARPQAQSSSSSPEGNSKRHNPSRFVPRRPRSHHARTFLLLACSNAFTDPTHRHYFGYLSFNYFTEKNELSFYSSARFRLRTATLFFYPTTLSKIVWRLANRFPVAYE